MQRATNRPRATAARIVVADTARMIRARLRASRAYVSGSLDDMASRRRGFKLADQLEQLSDDMLGGGMTPQDAKQLFAEMGARIVDTRRAG